MPSTKRRGAMASNYTSNYKGDTPSKAVARVTFWSALNHIFPKRSPESLRAFVLSSKYSGDVSFLTAQGVLQKNILACDVDPKAIAATRRRFPGVRVYFGDYVSASKRYTRQFDAVFLDTTSIMSKALARTMVESAFRLAASHALIGFAFVLGRENGQNAKDLSTVQLLHDEMCLVLAENDDRLLYAMELGLIPKEPLETAKQNVLKAADVGSGRDLVMDQAAYGATARTRDVCSVRIGSIRYQSVSQSGSGTSMEISLYEFRRALKRKSSFAHARWRLRMHKAINERGAMFGTADGGTTSDAKISTDFSLEDLVKRMVHSEGGDEERIAGLLNLKSAGPFPPPPSRRGFPENGDEVLIASESGLQPAVVKTADQRYAVAVRLENSRRIKVQWNRIRWADGSMVGLKTKEIRQMDDSSLQRVGKGTLVKGETLYLKDGKQNVKGYREVKVLRPSQKGAQVRMMDGGVHGVTRFAYHNELFRPIATEAQLAEPCSESPPPPPPPLNKNALPADRGAGIKSGDVKPSQSAKQKCPVNYEGVAFSIWVKRFRKFKGVKQRDFATTVGIPVHRLSKVERAEITPTDGDVLALAEYVSMLMYDGPSLDDLMEMRDRDTAAGVRALQRTFKVNKQGPVQSVRFDPPAFKNPQLKHLPAAAAPAPATVVPKPLSPINGFMPNSVPELIVKPGKIIVELGLSPDEELELHRRAAAAGKTLREWAAELLFDALTMR